jgi:hypothetical protein
LVEMPLDATVRCGGFEIRFAVDGYGVRFGITLTLTLTLTPNPKAFGLE